MRKILVNETNINLKYSYFQIYLLDGISPATGLVGLQPEISINGALYSTSYIGIFQEIGVGSYRSLISDFAFSTIGNIILGHYKNTNTLDSYAEKIEVVSNYSQLNTFDDDNVPIFNSYISIQEAEFYFIMKLNSQEWNTATLQDKMKALNSATQDIDNLRFKGIKTSCTQLNEFPRTINGAISSIVPREIKIACCEIAIKYLEGIDLENEISNANVSAESFANVQESYHNLTAVECFQAGINSQKAWKYLKPFLVDGLSLRIVRN